MISGADEPSESDYVTIATVNGVIEEAQLCSFLQGMGIPTRARGEALRRTHSIVVDGIAATEIQVPQHLAADARELIAQAERGEPAMEPDAAEDPADDDPPMPR